MNRLTVILLYLISLSTWASEKHWSFQPVKRVKVTAKSNPIDYFVSRKLRKNNLKLATKADRITLLRRAYLDLTGLPPDPASVKKFVEAPGTTEIARIIF